MMLKRLITISLTMLALMLAASCGDDECPNCPTNVDTVTITESVTDTLTDTVEVPQDLLAWINGYIQLSPEFCVETWIWANGGANPFIDSLTVGDSVFTNTSPSYWYHESDPYFYISECEDAATPMYTSGDTAVVSLYGSGLSSTCRVVALDYYDDWADILIPDDGDTAVVYNGTGFECFWTEIENAEWYGVELNYYLDSSGTTINKNIYTYTFDTSFTVADTVDGHAVEYVYLYALPTTGPDPQSGLSNWTGDLVTGKLYSIGDYAWADVYFVVATATGKAAVTTSVERPKKSPQDIIKAVYDAYK